MGQSRDNGCQEGRRGEVAAGSRPALFAGGKGLLRQKMRAARDALSPAEIEEKSERIAKRLLAHPAYQKAASVMCYASFGSEVRTDGLIKSALAAGKAVAVPVCLPDQRLLPSLVCFFPDELEPGRFGVPEPKAGCLRPASPADFDLIIVPGVAFDRRGYRLGYGAGYYDRFLRETRPGAVFLGLAFELQVVEDVQPEPHDVPVHIIVTEERVYEICRYFSGLNAKD